MGLFDALFGSKPKSNVEETNDQIWMTNAAKFRGITRELSRCIAAKPDCILLIAHFKDTLDSLNVIEVANPLGVPLMIALAEWLSIDIAARLHLDSAARVEMIVAERHPRLSADEALIRFAQTLPCPCRVIHLLSLEDPVLGKFAGEWVSGVLHKLGMAEDEAIDSRLVSRRLKASQKKIEDQATGNAKANSAAEWLQINMAGSSSGS